MQEIHFEAYVKDGYIKLPARFSRLNNKKVVVDIVNKNNSCEENEDRVKNVKEFLKKCTGILANTGIPTDISIKDARKMRLDEKYGL